MTTTTESPTITIDEYKASFEPLFSVARPSLLTADMIDMKRNEPSGISAMVIADSASEEGHRLTTLEVRFPRCILAEVNTHRLLSRNSASSRAIPVVKILERVKTDPFVPLRFGVNQPGMQSTTFYAHTSPGDLHARSVWLAARDTAVEHLEMLDSLGVHKQHANRLIEPFLWHTAIITATSWENMLDQRYRSDDPQPEYWVTAMAIRRALDHSGPEVLGWGDYHLPYVFEEDRKQFDLNDLIKLSVARCARVSYLTHDGVRDPQEDLALTRRLLSARPMHASPFEHVARPSRFPTPGNFTGWRQHRHDVEDLLGIESLR